MPDERLKRRGPPIIDLTGQRFGQLVVLKQVTNRNQRSGIMWLCRCDCGLEKEIMKVNLRANGGTLSCGCGRGYPIGLSTGKHLLNAYRQSAHHRQIPFDISWDDFHRLCQQRCSYCNVIPKQIHKGTKGLKGQYIYNGIDRVDNNFGYVLGNVVTCCKTCNYMKHSLSKEEFIAHVRRIVAFQECF